MSGRYGHDTHDREPNLTPPTKQRERVRPSVERTNASTARYEKTLSADEIKTKIKKLIFDNPRISMSELQGEMKENRIKISNITLSAIRTEYRHTVRFLRARGATGLPEG